VRLPPPPKGRRLRKARLRDGLPMERSQRRLGKYLNERKEMKKRDEQTRGYE